MKKLYLFVVITFVFSSLWAGNGSTQSGSASRDSRTTSPVSNISREDEYDVKFYWLNLDIEASSSFISGNALTSALVVAAAGMDTFSLELEPSVFIIDSAEVQLNGGGLQTATVVRGSGSEVDVLLPFHAATNDMVSARVYYQGTASVSVGNPNGPGFFLGVSGFPANFSASPPYNSSTWWPCKQNLTDKADSSWVFITTDSTNLAYSNGLLTNTVNLGGGKKQYQWKSHHLIDFYLVSFVVGPHTSNDTIEYFHPIGRTDSMPVMFYNFAPSYTLNVLQLFSEKFGLYPFYNEKCGIAGVYLGGGMENQTMISIGAEGSVIEHETTHQWFGDNVTCASYLELWLNEGFARWGESLYPELAAPDSAAASAARINIANQYENGNSEYGALGGLGWPNGSIIYTETDTVDVFPLYGGTPYSGRDMHYEKPAMMINTLRFLVNNDSLFFLGLRNYQTMYAGQAAHSNDFIDAMEGTVGIDLTQFFDQWLYGYGFPTFNIRWNQRNNQVAIEVKEETSDPAQTPLFQTPVQIAVERLFHADTGWQRVDTTVRVSISDSVSNFQVGSDNADSIIGFVVDPNQWILNGPGSVTLDTSLAITSGIREVATNNAVFTIFPNPASDYLNIQSDLPYGQPADAELYNDLGQQVLSQQMKPYDKLNLQGLPDGVYILQLNHLYSYKVVVTH